MQTACEPHIRGLRLHSTFSSGANAAEQILRPGGSVGVLMQPYRDSQYETMSWGVQPRNEDERWFDADGGRSFLFRGLIAVTGVFIGEEDRLMDSAEFTDMPWFYVGVAAPLAGPGVVPGFKKNFWLLTLPARDQGSERLPLVVPRRLEAQWLNHNYDTRWVPTEWASERHKKVWPGEEVLAA